MVFQVFFFHIFGVYNTIAPSCVQQSGGRFLRASWIRIALLISKKLLTEQKLLEMKVALGQVDKSKKLSKAKKVITELITNTSMPNDQELLLIANGILLPPVKTFNGKRVKMIQ